MTLLYRLLTSAAPRVAGLLLLNNLLILLTYLVVRPIPLLLVVPMAGTMTLLLGGAASALWAIKEPQTVADTPQPFSRTL